MKTIAFGVFVLTIFSCPSLLWAQTSGCGMTVNAGPDQTLCFPGGGVQLNGSISGDYLDFSWSPLTGLINANTLQPTAIVNQTLTYALTGRSFDPANNLVVNGDFSQGDVGFSSDYINNPNLIYLPGYYAIVTSPDLIYSNFPPCDDHSPGQGNLMLVNGSTNSNDDIWCQTIPVTTNTEYVFGAWVGTIVPFNLAQISFLINGQPLGPPITAPSEVCSWTQFSQNWNSGNATSATICIRDMNTANLGNDFGLDDIFFAPICSVSDSVQVAVVQPIATGPVLQFLSCSTGQLTINASGSSTGLGYSYQWTTQDGHIVSGATTLSPLVDETGTYVLTVTYTGGGVTCTAMTTVIVTNDPTTPLAFATPQGDLDCNTPTATIQGAGSSQGANISYQWTTTGGNIISDPAAQQIQVDAPGVYTLLVTNTTNGCTASASAQVDFFGELPEVTAVDSLVVTCAVFQIEMDGTGSSQGPEFSYLWTTADGTILSGDSTLTPLVEGPGTYTLTVANTGTGCEDALSVTVLDQRDIPLLVIDTPAAITCWDTLVVLDASGSSPDSTLVWEWSTAGGHFASATDSLVVLVDAEGSYQLVLFDPANGCADTATVWVADQRIVPGIILTSPPVLTCQDTLVTLVAANILNLPASYQWYTLDGQLAGPTDTLEVLAQAPGTYWLEATDSLSGCLASDTVSVWADITPPEVFAGDDLVLNCSTDSLPLSGLVDTGSGLWVAAWTTPDGALLSGDSTLTPFVGQEGLYILQAWDLINGCSYQDSVVVAADDNLPVVQIALPPALTCVQDSVQLDAGGTSEGPDFAYEWTSPDGLILSGSGSLQPWVGQYGIYLLTVTDLSNGCSAVASVEVNVDTLAPLADAGVGGDLTCAMPALELDGSASSAGPEYEVIWTSVNGNILSGATTYAPVAGAPGTYFIEVFNTQNGCLASDSVIIAGDLDLPFADAGNAVELNCFEGQATLDGSASDAGPELVFLWATPDGNLLSGADGLTPQVDLPGTYVLQVLDTATGCAGYDTVVVTANFQVPAVTAVASGILTCGQQAVEVSAEVAGSQGPFAYTWTAAPGQIGGPADQPLAQALAPGAYVVNIMDLSNGCSAEGQVQVLIDTVAPFAQAVALQSLSCEQLQVVLSGAGSSQGPVFTYLWTTPDGNLAGSSDQIEVLVDAPGTYILSVVNGQNSCSALVEVTLIADTSPPEIDAGPVGLLTCSEPQVTLQGSVSGTGDWEIQWQTQEGNLLSGSDGLEPQVDAPGWYVLVVEDLDNGCSAIDSVWVEADQDAPVVLITDPEPITCQHPQRFIDAQGSSQGASFAPVWTTIDGNILSGAQSLAALVDQAGTYMLTIQNTDNGCWAADSVMVVADTLSPSVEAGPSAFFPCNANAYILEGVMVGASGPYELWWTTQDGSILGGAQTLSPQVGGPGVYHLEVTDLSNGCMASDEVVLLEQGIEDLVAEVVHPVCPGDAGQIRVEQVEGGTPPYSYALNGGAFQLAPGFEGLLPGVYELEVKDGAGCSLVQAIVLDMPLPLLVQLPAVIPLSLGATATLQPQVNIPVSQIAGATWSPAAGLSCVDCLEPEVRVSQTTSYELTVADERGCLATASVLVEVDRSISLYAPNIFSPNADGINDEFRLFAREGQVGKIRTFQVWSRWGELVYAVSNVLPDMPEAGWDGTVSGRPATAGVYGWWAEVEWLDGRVLVYTGDVTLLR